MLRKLLKIYAYSKKPKTTFVLLNPITTAQLLKVPFDLKTAYAPRLTALATALLVAPLAYRLGRRSAEGTLFGRKSPTSSPSGPGLLRAALGTVPRGAGSQPGGAHG